MGEEQPVSNPLERQPGADQLAIPRLLGTPLLSDLAVCLAVRRSPRLPHRQNSDLVVVRAGDQLPAARRQPGSAAQKVTHSC